MDDKKPRKRGDEWDGILAKEENPASRQMIRRALAQRDMRPTLEEHERLKESQREWWQMVRNWARRDMLDPEAVMVAADKAIEELDDPEARRYYDERRAQLTRDNGETPCERCAYPVNSAPCRELNCSAHARPSPDTEAPE